MAVAVAAARTVMVRRRRCHRRLSRRHSRRHHGAAQQPEQENHARDAAEHDACDCAVAETVALRAHGGGGDVFPGLQGGLAGKGGWEFLHSQIFTCMYRNRGIPLFVESGDGERDVMSCHVCQYVCLSVCLSVCLFIYIYTATRLFTKFTCLPRL